MPATARLSRAVAVAEASGPQAGLAALEAIPTIDPRWHTERGYRRRQLSEWFAHSHQSHGVSGTPPGIGAAGS
jgi:hypothetical protein